ncbi:E4 SUMO-protein ligase PIAL1-like [Macadamia integrifolia]|uniref:E4 SUMO-protein ligase PIAL1-like n=1 Tax=Macadamia integrifolia TaxID=60698 RepID=UPI001C5026DF|nr:E4 SUMO-protein ligase PIAL1-like [Macadamia integrifolia]
MAGAITQRQPGSSTGGGVVGGGQVPPGSPMSMANSFRVAAVATRLTSHISGIRTDPNEFINLCLALARGIDYAVANNEVPNRAQELPMVVKQVCHRKNNYSFQAVIMVLMVSVKNACKNGWFLGNDNEELLTLANEILSSFCSSGNINIEPSSAFSAIPEIMSRYDFPFLPPPPGRNQNAENRNFSLLKDENLEISNTSSMAEQNQPIFGLILTDSDIIEGPSRISLNCPISHTRIRTPVKGHLCKHHQCFDYGNFLEINSRRPSWRCPHCNHSVCYTDIRIDQHMVKVLEEVAEGVSDVIILVDGSWKAAFDSNDQTHQPHGGTLSYENNGPEKHEFSKDPANVVDLTGEDDERYTANLFETEDRKPFRDNFQGYSVATSLAIPMAVNTTAEVGLSSGLQIEDDFWEGMFLSISSDTFGPAGSSSMLDTAAGAISEATPTNFVPSPVLTDAISPALNRADVQGATQPTTSVHPVQFSVPFNLQIQPSQFGNSIVSNEYGRTTVSRNISRTPIAIQALPAQTQVPSSNQRLRTNLNSLLPDGAPSVSQSVMDTNGFNAVGGEAEMQQQFSRSLMNPLPTSDIASSSMQQPLMIQSWDHQQRIHFPTQSLPQVVGLLATTQVAGALRSSSQLSHQQLPNSRLPQNMNRPSSLLQSTHFPRTQIQQVGARGVGLATGGTTNQHLLPMSAGLRTAQMARPLTVPVQLHPPRTGPSLAMPMDEQGGGNVLQPVSSADGLGELSSEHNWRPSGRMRGSLTGPAYSAALSQYMGQPTPPAQFSGPPPNQISSPSLSQMHVLVTNSINAHGLRQQAYSRTGEASMPGTLGIHPGRSMGHLG